MCRFPCSLVAVAALTTVLDAQCHVPGAGTPVTLLTTHPTLPAADEGRSAPVPLGFAFPIAGATAPAFTHAVIESNGVLYLTNNAPAIGTTTFGTVDWIGVSGDSPRIAPYWADLAGLATTWSVRTSSTAGVFTVEWVDVNESGFLPTKSFRCRLFGSGEVEFGYTAMNTDVGFVSFGLSPGNGIADPEGPSDLSTGPTSLDGIVHEDLDTVGSFDLGGSRIRFTPSGTGYVVAVQCTPARHVSYGAGCYDLARQAYYEDFDAFNPFDLAQQSLSMLFVGDGYVVTSGLTSFVTPSGAATPLALTDDDDTTVGLGASLVFPGGATSALTVCSNGFVSAGPGNGVNYLPDLFELLNSPQASWRSWLDLDPSLPGSGQVTFEEIAGIAYVTWNGVFAFGTNAPNTMQMQFDTGTGNVHMVWRAMSPPLTGTMVGYAPAGSSRIPAATDLSTALGNGFATAPDLLALQLAAAPAPISTPSLGTSVAYTTTNLPQLAPGTYVGLLVVSWNRAPAPGIDLTTLGAPGCFAHLATIDGSALSTGGSPSQTVLLSIPPGIPAGTQLFAQAVGLFPPNSLGGLNAFGIVTSNGIATTVQPQ
jgi:hypothetical protein